MFYRHKRKEDITEKWHSGFLNAFFAHSIKKKVTSDQQNNIRVNTIFWTVNIFFPFLWFEVCARRKKNISKMVHWNKNSRELSTKDDIKFLEESLRRKFFFWRAYRNIKLHPNEKDHIFFAFFHNFSKKSKRVKEERIFLAGTVNEIQSFDWKRTLNMLWKIFYFQNRKKSIYADV